MTINEVRERYYGLPPKKWGDVWWAPGGFGPVDDSDPSDFGAGAVVPQQTGNFDFSEPKQIDEFKRAYFNIPFSKLEPPEPDKKDKKAWIHYKRWIKFKRSLNEDEKDIRQIASKHLKNQLKRLEEKLKKKFKKKDISKAKEDDVASRLTLDLAEENAEWVELAKPIYEKAVKKHGGRLLQELGFEAQFDADNKDVVKFIEEVLTKRGSEINGVSQELARGEIAAALKNQEDFKGVMNRLTKFFEGPHNEFRARRIARTEAVTLANGGKQEAMKQEGVEKKEWVSELLPTTRESHAEVHGTVIPIDEKFEVRKRKGGTDFMDGPGDPTASAENVAQCLCSLEPAISNKELAALLEEED
jgi:hypothetical protein